MAEELQPPENGVPRWVASDVLGVINVFERMLLAMEARLVQKMDDNSRLASERWVQHDATLQSNEKRIVERFARLEQDLIKVETVLNDHIRKEEREEITARARIQPIKGSIAWFWKNWRDVVLLIIGVIALGTFLVEAYGRVFLGPHAP